MNAKLFDNMIRYGIGVDPWFWERNADAPNYPPHNIEQLGEDRYRLTLAVAGFAPEEMQIMVEDDLLTVKGWKGNPSDGSKSEDAGHSVATLEDGRKLLYSGIAFRNWNRQFKIGEYVRVDNAAMRHGLLMIDLIREIPEVRKPKLVEITS